MPAQRYDVAGRDGLWEVRWWQPTNTPVLDRDGTVAGVLHHVVPLDGPLDGDNETHRRELAAAHASVKEAEQRYRQLLDAAPDAFVLVTADGTITMVNAQAESLFGHARADMIGRPIEMLVPVHQRSKHRALRTADATHKPRPMGSGLELQALRRDGTLVPVEVSLSPVTTQQGQLIAASVRDVSVRAAAERQLRESERRYKLTLDLAPAGIAQVGLDGRWLRVNPALCQILGYDEQTLLGLRFQDVTYEPDLDLDEAHVEALVRGERSSSELEKRYRRRDGTLVWVHLHVRLVRDDDQRPVYFLVHIADITEQRVAAERLRLLASTDRLTGLVNRATLNGQVVRAVHGPCALLLLDLDHFKTVNDTHGHIAGDALLVEVARRLRAALREDSTVARLGGDEFAVLLTGADVPEAARVARRVLHALGEAHVSVPTLHDGVVQVPVGGTIGLAVCRRLPRTASREDAAAELYRQADVALYDAKARGRGGVGVYDSRSARRHQRLLAEQAEVRAGLDQDRLVTYAQPIVDIRSGQEVGVEALARLLRHDGSVVMPDVFLPAASAAGLGPEVDIRMLNSELRRLAADPTGSGVVHVNASADTLLHEVWWRHIDQALTAAPHIARRLHVEVTEQTLMQATGRAARVLRELRERGIKVGLDDFGTGYSALSSLQTIGVDFIKLDRSLVQELGSSERADTVAAALIDLAHALGLTVVAEGVAALSHLHRLRQLDCDQAQGFLLGAPVAQPFVPLPVPRQPVPGRSLPLTDRLRVVPGQEGDRRRSADATRTTSIT
jgi:diguanylate cyclase (GGDEF)-like protein/PAS domain S-box-containing protein